MHVDLSEFANGNHVTDVATPPNEDAGSSDASSDSAELAPEDEDTGDELSRLRKLWPHLLDQLNARSRNMAAVFRDPAQVRPFAVNGKTVTISFRYPIHAQRARGDQQRRWVEQSLGNTLGYPCLLETITFDEEGRGPKRDGDAEGGKLAPRAQKEKSPAPHETPRGRAVMNTFGVEKFEDD
jgi:hypothetical protein